MSRAQMMAAVAIAAGLALTIAEIATSDADDVDAIARLADPQAKQLDLANRLGLRTSEQDAPTPEPRQRTLSDLFQAYW